MDELITLAAKAWTIHATFCWGTHAICEVVERATCQFATTWRLGCLFCSKQYPQDNQRPFLSPKMSQQASQRLPLKDTQLSSRFLSGTQAVPRSLAATGQLEGARPPNAALSVRTAAGLR